MNIGTGQISENVELENLDEEETDDFKREWRERSARAGLSRRSHHPHHHQLASNRLYHHPSSGSHQPQLAIEHGHSAGSSSNRYRPNSSKYTNSSSQHPKFHHSDTIDLTDDSPIIIQEVEEIEQLPLPQHLPVKRKASSSNDVNIQRKHRQSRF
jgi:hypothetical protein